MQILFYKLKLLTVKVLIISFKLQILGELPKNVKSFENLTFLCFKQIFLPQGISFSIFMIIFCDEKPKEA